MSRNKSYEKRYNSFDDDDWDDENQSEYKKEDIRQKRRNKYKARDDYFYDMEVKQ